MLTGTVSASSLDDAVQTTVNFGETFDDPAPALSVVGRMLTNNDLRNIP
jgi:hypothetical protein